MARLVTVFGAGFDHDVVIEKARTFLNVVNSELARSQFIAASHPTIADVALYSYIAHAPEGGVDLERYAAIRAWLERIEALHNAITKRTRLNAKDAVTLGKFFSTASSAIPSIMAVKVFFVKPSTKRGFESSTYTCLGEILIFSKPVFSKIGYNARPSSTAA